MGAYVVGDSGRLVRRELSSSEELRPDLELAPAD
jgi:hypothetical protein